MGVLFHGMLNILPKKETKVRNLATVILNIYLLIQLYKNNLNFLIKFRKIKLWLPAPMGVTPVN